MQKKLFIFLSIFIYSTLSAEESSKDVAYLKKILYNRIVDCEEYKKLLREPFDIYKWYSLCGKQEAYEDVIILIDKIIKDEKSSTPQFILCNEAN